MKKVWTIQDREAGNVIEWFDSRKKAEKALTECEAEDKAEGTYTPDFYEVEEHEISVPEKVHDGEYIMELADGRTVHIWQKSRSLWYWHYDSGMTQGSASTMREIRDMFQPYWFNY